MDAAKSNALNSTIRFVFSLSHGILLVFGIIFVYVLFGETRFPSIWMLMGIFTAASFVIGFFLNTLIQYLACSKINVVQVASASGIPAGITAAVIGLFGILPSIESVVYSVLPETLTPIYKKSISQGFYLFWSGMYGQLISSGFAQSCI